MLDLELESDNAQKASRKNARRAFKEEMAAVADKKQKAKLKKYYGDGTRGEGDLDDRKRGAQLARNDEDGA